LWALINPENKILIFILVAATAFSLQGMKPQPLADCQHAYLGEAQEVSVSHHLHDKKTRLGEDVVSVSMPSLSYSFFSGLSGSSSKPVIHHPKGVILENQSLLAIPVLKRAFYHVVNINAP